MTEEKVINKYQVVEADAKNASYPVKVVRTLFELNGIANAKRAA